MDKVGIKNGLQIYFRMHSADGANFVKCISFILVPCQPHDELRQGAWPLRVTTVSCYVQ